MPNIVKTFVLTWVLGISPINGLKVSSEKRTHGPQYHKPRTTPGFGWDETGCLYDIAVKGMRLQRKFCYNLKKLPLKKNGKVQLTPESMDYEFYCYFVKWDKENNVLEEKRLDLDTNPWGHKKWEPSWDEVIAWVLADNNQLTRVLKHHMRNFSQAIQCGGTQCHLHADADDFKASLDSFNRPSDPNHWRLENKEKKEEKLRKRECDYHEMSDGSKKKMCDKEHKSYYYSADRKGRHVAYNFWTIVFRKINFGKSFTKNKKSFQKAHIPGALLAWFGTAGHKLDVKTGDAENDLDATLRKLQEGWENIKFNGKSLPALETLLTKASNDKFEKDVTWGGDLKLFFPSHRENLTTKKSETKEYFNPSFISVSMKWKNEAKTLIDMSIDHEFGYCEWNSNYQN